jgi:MFS family permease
MLGLAARLTPYALAFLSSLCIMTLELVSSRLVARHVGSSLTVWTSVIGIILGGICLGNVLGGRLADRVDPRRAIGPLLGLASFLTLGTLWINAWIERILPAPDALNWELRTVLVVTLDFLVPATVLGMIGPVVAKLAVERSRRTGSAIGDVYFSGAVGSIAGTFLAGFVLMYLLPTSTIIIVVAAALAILAGLVGGFPGGRFLGLLVAGLLALGSIPPLVRALELGAVDLGSYAINHLALAGAAAAAFLTCAAVIGLATAPPPERAPASSAEEPADDSTPTATPAEPAGRRPSLADLAALAFLISLAFMALEMAAGRLVARHLGSSIYGWTSVIGVLLAGLSLGNYLGGRAANRIRSENQASWLFLAASILVLSVLILETPPGWFRDLVGLRSSRSILGAAPGLSSIRLTRIGEIPLSWPFRVLAVVAVMFFLPSVSLGTVSPVVAKLAVDRLRRFQRTGTAIGEVYAWGMVGSILGTFLTGFLLIDFIGTKGVILLMGTLLALAATTLGTVWHALWAGIPLGLCVIAFTPGAWFERMGQEWGIREERGDPQTTEDAYAWVDESNYYFIKVTNEPEDQGRLQKRSLVLDNLIHGYFVLGHPERLDYEYEHIYALVAYRAAKASGRIETGPGGHPQLPGPRRTESVAELPAHVFSSSSEPGQEPPTPRHLSDPNSSSSPPAAEPAGKPVEPAGKPAEPAGKPVEPAGKPVEPAGKPVEPAGKPAEPAGKPVEPAPTTNDAPPKPAQEAPKAEEKPGSKSASPPPVWLPNVPRSSLKTLFLGGGAYTFQRHIQFAYPGTEVDVAEIDPAVTKANHQATGLPPDTPIVTYWGDARQFVERHYQTKKYDLIFGDAFNDFSVPWHLTTREFNEKIASMLSPSGVYMINIIDVYESDETALKKADRRIEREGITGSEAQEQVRREELERARRLGGFLGSWAKTALLTFPHLYIFGTDRTPGSGLRETFVVVASRRELDLEDLAFRADDPQFYQKERRSEPVPFGPEHKQAVLENRSRGIVLTDDYAPVENLLAPVAETRADD